MFVHGYCEINDWPAEALDDLEDLLAGERLSWQGKAWEKAALSRCFDVERVGGGKGGRLIITDDAANDEPFCEDDLSLMLQSIMRHHALDGLVKISTWGEPEGAEKEGDGQVCYVSRFGSMNINPMRHDVPPNLNGVVGMLDAWKRDARLMADPAERAAHFRDPVKDPVNLLAYQRDEIVRVVPVGWESPYIKEETKPLDVSARASAWEIVLNVCDLFPDAVDIRPLLGMPDDLARGIKQISRELMEQNTEPGPVLWGAYGPEH